jgi:predicted phosphodiesterase
MKYKKDTNFILLTDIHSDISIPTKKAKVDKWVDQCVFLATEHIINYVFILGDICNQGNHDGYYFAKELKKKINKLDRAIRPEVLMIPGNHDLVRDSVKNTSEKLKVGKHEVDIKSQFYDHHDNRVDSSHILKFINSLDSQEMETLGALYFDPYIKAHTVFKKDQPLFGYKFDLKNRICILRFNSCWNALDSSTDNGNIVIGKNIVESLFLLFENDLRKNHLKREDVTVFSLVHHPPSWWCYNELYAADSGEGTTYGEIVKNTDILLCGHTHGTYTGYSVIHDGIPSDNSEENLVLFIESPATLTYSSGSYYPSAITLLQLIENHTKMNKISFVYKESKKCFEKEIVTIKLPRFDGLNKVSTNEISFLLPNFESLDINDVDLKKYKEFISNPDDYLKQAIYEQFDVHVENLKDKIQYISKEKIWIPIIIDAKNDLRFLLSSFKQIYSEYFLDDQNFAEKRQVIIIIIYRSRFYQAKRNFTQLIDLENIVYDTFIKSKEEFVKDNSHIKKYYLERYFILFLFKYRKIF